MNNCAVTYDSVKNGIIDQVNKYLSQDMEVSKINGIFGEEVVKTAPELKIEPSDALIYRYLLPGINWWEEPSFKERNPNFDYQAYLNNVNKFGKNFGELPDNLKPTDNIYLSSSNYAAKVLKPEQLEIFKRLQNAGLVTKRTAPPFMYRGREVTTYTIPKIPMYAQKSSLYYTDKPDRWDKDYQKRDFLQKIIDDNKLTFLRIRETENAFLVELGDFTDNQMRLFTSAPSEVQSSRAGYLTKQKVLNFLKKIGFTDIQRVSTITHNGIEVQADAYVDMINGVMKIVEGKEDYTLPEEAMHILVELIEMSSPELYRRLDKEVIDYQIYRDVVNSPEYTTSPFYKKADGSLNYTKLKKEAIAKVLAEYLINIEENTQDSANKLAKIHSWWQDIIIWIRELFGQYKNPFKQALAKMEEGEDMGVFSDIKPEEVYLSASKKTVDERDKEYSYTKDEYEQIRDLSSKSGITKVDKKYYKNGKEWEGKRVTDLVNRFYEELFRNRPLDEGKKDYYASLAADGERIHTFFEEAFRTLVDYETGLPLIATHEFNQSLINNAIDQRLSEKIQEYLSEFINSYPEGTRFLSETMIADESKPLPKDHLVGTVDFIAILPDPAEKKVANIDIYDWKTKQSYEEIKDYKREGWSKQIGWYRDILHSLNPEFKFRRLRAIPIEREYYKNTDKLRNVYIGQESLEADRRRRAVISPEETTGNEIKDKLTEQLRSIYHRFLNLFKEKKIPNRLILNQIDNAIYELHTSNSVQGLITYLVELGQKMINLHENVKKNSSLEPSVLNSLIGEINLYRGIYEDLSGITDFVISQESEIDQKQQETLSYNVSVLNKNITKLNNDAVSILDELAKQNGIYTLTKPEKLVGMVANAFRSVGNHDVASLRLAYELVRKAYNKAEIDTDEELKYLKEIKRRFDNYMKRKGLSKTEAIGKLINYETGHIHSKVDSSFYKERDEVFAKKDAKEIKKFVEANYNMDEYRKWYNAYLAENVEFWNSLKDSEDEDEAARIKTYKREQFEREFNIDKYPITAFNNRNRLVWSRNIKEEKWESSTYKEITEDEDLLTIYNYFLKKNHELVEIGAIEEWRAYTFFPNVLKGSADIFSIEGNNWVEKMKDISILGYQNFKRSLTVSDYQLNYSGKIDPRTGEKVGQRFVPYIQEFETNTSLYREAAKELGITAKIDDKTVTADKLPYQDLAEAIKKYKENPANAEKYREKIISLRSQSFDIFTNYGLMTREIAKEKYLQQTDEILRGLLHLEQNKETIETNIYGNIKNVGGKPVPSKKKGQNAHILEKYVKYITEGQALTVDADYMINFSLKKLWNKLPIGEKYKFDLSKSSREPSGISVTKLLMKTNNFQIRKTLGLNASAAISNLFGSLFSAEKLYNPKASTEDLMKAFTMMTSGAFWQTEEMKKNAALVDYFLPLLDNRPDFKSTQLSVSKATQVLSREWLMWPQRSGDEIVQLKIFFAILMNTGLIDGKIVNLREMAMNEKRRDGYYRKSPEERKKADAEFNRRLKELKDKYSLVKTAQFKKVKVGEKEEVVIDIPGVSRNSEQVENFRAMVQTISKDAMGAMNEFDFPGYRYNIFGRILMTFMNWIPRMGDVRWAEFHYSQDHQAYEYGRYRMLYRAFWANWMTSIAKVGIPIPYLTGKITKSWGREDYIKKALEIYQEKKKIAIELGQDKGFISEDEFVDRYLKGLDASMEEIRTFTFLWLILILAIFKADDDDEPEEKSIKALIRRQIDKMSDETGFFLNPKAFIDIANRGAPVMSFVRDVYNLGSSVGKEVFGLTVENLGFEQGEIIREKAKPLKYTFKVLPVFKEILNYIPTFDEEIAKDWGIKIMDRRGF